MNSFWRDALNELAEPTCKIGRHGTHALLPARTALYRMHVSALPMGSLSQTLHDVHVHAQASTLFPEASSCVCTPCFCAVKLRSAIAVLLLFVVLCSRCECACCSPQKCLNCHPLQVLCCVYSCASSFFHAYLRPHCEYCGRTVQTLLFQWQHHRSDSASLLAVQCSYSCSGDNTVVHRCSFDNTIVQLT